MTNSEGPTEGSAARALASWANAQDGWVRLIAIAVLEQRFSFAGPSVKECYVQLLGEKGLDAADPATIGPIEIASSSTDVAPAIELVSVSGSRFVNRLADDQVIEFNPEMTIVFGENASGKTGYVRVLKAVAGARSAEPVLSDVYQSTRAMPSSRIGYRVGGEAEEFEWSEGVDAPQPLRRLSVFDAPATLLHVDEDLAYSYMPSEIALFEAVHSSLAAVKELLGEDIAARSTTSNPFVSRFQRGTSSFAVIETLRATTDMSEVRNLAIVDDAEKARMAAVEYIPEVSSLRVITLF